MKFKIRFKLTAILVSALLVALFISQCYWLKGLYDTNLQRTEKDITDAMVTADFNELYLRMYQLEKSVREERISIGDTSKHQSEVDIGITYKITNLSNDTTWINDVTEIMQLMTKMHIFLKSFHDTIDVMLTSNPVMYDSLLCKELAIKNILVPHLLVKRETTDSVNYTYTSVDTTQQASLWQNEAYYDLPVVINGQFSYRLYLKSPIRIVLRQMTGILITSFLLVMLIITTFVYLLRTILRQKTLEELKTDFTNNITHELKTPIAVAYAANDAMLNFGEVQNEKQKKYLSIVREQLIRLSGIVEQILTLAVENRTTLKLNPESVRIVSLLPSLIEQHKMKASKPLQVEVNIPDDFTVTADRTHLHNILSNLMDNAVKYADKETVQITVSAFQTGNEICISVTDNGAGISEAHQSKIFDRYYRVPTGNLHNVKGYGLGLCYVRDLMARHKGSVSLKSQIGKGSTFMLHFNA